MRKQANKYETLEPETLYHIFNRTNGKELLFRDDGNYRFFLKKYKEQIPSFADTLCFCLMPTHFHFLIRIKHEQEIRIPNVPNGKLENERSEDSLQKMMSKQFSNLFNSYTKSYNKLFSRHGALFTPNYKRKKVTTPAYLLSLVRYIHQNPVEANLCDKPEQWAFSSFNDILINNNSFVKSKEVIAWYDDLNNFRYMHRRYTDSGGFSFE
jgi:putative transposase